MPIYEFRCNKCGNIFEELVFSSDKDESFSYFPLTRMKVSPAPSAATVMFAGSCLHFLPVRRHREAV